MSNKTTALNLAIEALEIAYKNAMDLSHEKSGTDEAALIGLCLFQQDFATYLKSLLPIEQQQIEDALLFGLDEIAHFGHDGISTAQDYFNSTFKK